MLEVCQSGNLVLACKVLYVKNYYFSKKSLNVKLKVFICGFEWEPETAQGLFSHVNALHRMTLICRKAFSY